MTINREQTQAETPSLSTGKKPTLSSLSMTAIHEPAPSNGSPASPTAAEPATIGKSLQIKGEVIGTESLYIDGNVEGAINLPDSRVTVSRDAQVSANIIAREVVVFGKVSGNIYASDRVDIRSEGSLIGDVTTQRISIGDGAFFKGGIDISKPAQGKDGIVVAGIFSGNTQTVATGIQV
jgi:cytoskeletal protein CcmA (bactofilin family)